MKNESKKSVPISRRSLLATMGAGSLSLAIAPHAAAAELAAMAEVPAPPAAWGASLYGAWTHDDTGLPCFDADLLRHPAPYASFSHILSTGTAGVLADRWGNLRLITGEDGPVCLTPTTGRTRSGLYAMLETSGQLYSLVHSEMKENQRIRYGTGSITYCAEMAAEEMRLSVTQEVYAPPDRDRALGCVFTFKNSGKAPIAGTLSLQSDVFIRPGLDYEEWLKSLRPESGAGFAVFRQASAALGDVYLVGGAEWTGGCDGHTLRLARQVALQPGKTVTAAVLLGYGRNTDAAERRTKMARMSPAAARRDWASRLAVFAVPALEPWMLDECRWALGQLLSFEFYDPILGEHYLHLGGYGFFPDADNPPDHVAYTVREAAENAVVIAHFEPRLAKSTLRWLAQMQVESGDIPKNYNYTRTRLDIATAQHDSDTEIWFLMALGEYVETTGDMAVLDDELAWFPSGKTSLWDHAQRAFRWITEGIGVGRHGLIRILEGDWNDYLSTVGAKGQGESVMNSGMAARAFAALARIARKKGDTEFAAKAAKWRDALRTAVGRAFDKEWFVGCFTDEGAPICGHDDRLYLNAQSWAALGGCGTKEQRQSGLQAAARACGSRIGMLLMSKAYSSPAPHAISWCPIPAGEGENGGIWPQTIHWTVWAMAQEGLLDLAAGEWAHGTLRNHSKEFPQVPYGIFNGPDCWSSRLAGSSEGWTQVNVFNRVGLCPMSPMISWQAFSALQIHRATQNSV